MGEIKDGQIGIGKTYIKTAIKETKSTTVLLSHALENIIAKWQARVNFELFEARFNGIVGDSDAEAKAFIEKNKFKILDRVKGDKDIKLLFKKILQNPTLYRKRSYRTLFEAIMNTDDYPQNLC